MGFFFQFNWGSNVRKFARSHVLNENLRGATNIKENIFLRQQVAIVPSESTSSKPFIALRSPTAESHQSLSN